MPAAVILLAFLAGPVAKRQAVDLSGLARPPASEWRAVAARFDADLGSLLRTYPNPASPTRAARLAGFYAGWLAAVEATDPEPLSAAARKDRTAFLDRLRDEAARYQSRADKVAGVAPLLPFAATIIELEDAKRRIEKPDPQAAAAAIDAVRKAATGGRAVIEKAFQTDPFVGDVALTRANVAVAADTAKTLRTALDRWHRFHTGYDPLFTWWTAQPAKEALAALDAYADYLAAVAADLPADEPDPRPSLSATFGRAAAKPSTDKPDIKAILAEPVSELVPVVQRYGIDRRGGPPFDWDAALTTLDFNKLSRPAQVDYLLLKNETAKAARRREVAKAGQPPRSKPDASGITGRPIGRAALIAELANELVPYTPEEIVALAGKEYAWCRAEITRASREMGYGDDWRAAVEKVKSLHVPPGGQPYLVRDLSKEAVAYVLKHDIVTVPPLCDETWRMEMMSPERQLLSPFFTGGEVVSVAFPTDAMSHAAKLQSLRGNNIHFGRATVQHELIPGHHLQGFMNSRHHPHRGVFGTALWTEGWALYGEFVLYARGDFARTPEDRVGFLTWRMHRCARVVFSFGFHLGTMSPQECVDYLVANVGFEPENAAAEVRRSFQGGYGPLYQAAYLLGAMQFRSLRKELVDGGVMSEKAYHDAVLKQNRIPVALVRAAITTDKLTPDLPRWRFAD